MIKLIGLVGGIAAGIVVGLGPAAAQSTQNLEKYKNSCDAPIAHWERELKIPARLLKAVALAETGRWDPVQRASFAWPWTVTAGKGGTYHDSKADALKEVRALKARGRSNIDVGCMQINLFHHPNAFASLEEALDPMRNVEYAARYLARQYAATGSWTEAAGAYHSTNPDFNQSYKMKVVALWNKARDTAPADKTPAAATTVTAEPVAVALKAPAAKPTAAAAKPRQPRAVPIDYDRTDTLNRRLRETRLAVRATEDAAARMERQAGLRQAQIDAWREKEVAGLDLVHLSAMQRAERAKKDKEALDAIGRGGPDAGERREAQIEAWERTGTWTARNEPAKPRTGLSLAAYK